MKKRSRRALAAATAVGAGVFTEELYRYMFCRESSKLFQLLFDTKGHEEGYYAFRDQAADRLRAIPCRSYTMVSARGDLLRGFYYPNGSEGKRMVLLVHGYRSEHTETAGMYYDYYRSRGIDMFCIDHTASGESGGEFIGFDVLETQDCLQWLKFIRSVFGEEVEIILHGFSMGAATVMQMSSHCPKNVKFIVEDSGYRNAQASLHHQIGPMYSLMRHINRAVAGYDLNDSDVTESLQNARVPILFVHGQEDKLVPFENGPQLYELYQGEKDCFFPEHTRHIESMYTSPQEYGRKLDSFVEKYMD